MASNNDNNSTEGAPGGEKSSSCSPPKGEHNIDMQATAQELRDYKPGKYSDVQDVDIGTRYVPPAVNIGVFGFNFAGKSSVINTIRAAVKEEPYREVAPVSDCREVSHTSDYEIFDLNPWIRLVDSKGFEEVGVESIERLQHFVNGFGTTQTLWLSPLETLRKWKQGIGEVYRRKAGRNRLEGYIHFALIAVPWNQESAQLNDIKRLTRELGKMKCPYLVLYTKTDRDVKPGQDADSREDGLKLFLSEGPKRAIKFVNYTHIGQKDPEIEQSALNLLKYCLMEAEMRGFAFQPPSKLQQVLKYVDNKLQRSLGCSFVHIVVILIVALMICYWRVL